MSALPKCFHAGPEMLEVGNRKIICIHALGIHEYHQLVIKSAVSCICRCVYKTDYGFVFSFAGTGLGLQSTENLAFSDRLTPPFGNITSAIIQPL